MDRFNTFEKVDWNRRRFFGTAAVILQLLKSA